MIGQIASGLITLMLAKFVLNDVPHAVGITSMEHPKTEQEATFPVEARRDLAFCKHMWDLEKTMGRSLTREEVAQRWENWKALRYRPKTEEERELIHSIKYGSKDLPERGRNWSKSP